MRWLTALLLLLAVLASSCSFSTQGKDKIAVIDWQKVMEAHPDQVRLKRMKDEYNLLLKQRQEQEAQGKLRLSDLQKLTRLREASHRGFLSADALAQLSDRQAAEEKILAGKVAAAAAAVDRELASRQQAVEDKYALPILNLRLKLEGVRLKPKEQEAVRAELTQVLLARDRERQAVDAEKQRLVVERTKGDRQAMQQRLMAYARELRSNMDGSLDKLAREDKTRFQQGPVSLQKLLGSMDRELDKRQQAIETLESSMKADVSGIVTKLAKEKGYTIVFYKYRANISAEDITQPVLQDLQKLSSKRKLADGLRQRADTPASKK
ncbi:MAG: hypothetical protein ACOYKB_04290 [Succiniclasticum sp.]|jgi:hypothetical protein